MTLKEQTITRGAILLGTASFLSYSLGLARDRLFASAFGAGRELDAYNAAFIIPDVIANLLFAGVSLSVLMPVITDIAARKKQSEAFQVASTVLTLGLFALLILAVLAFLGMPTLIGIVAPGFDAEQKELGTGLSRLLLFSPVLFVLSNALGSILVAQKRFTGYAFSPVFYNLGIVGGMLILAPTMGIYGAAVGTIFGAFLHFGIRFGELLRTPFRYSPKVLITHPAVLRVGRLMVPRMVGLLGWQVNLWAWTAIASTLAAGSIAIFSFSRNLQSLPVSLFGIALATAVAPTLTEHASRKQFGKFVQRFQAAATRIFFFVIPAATAMILLRTEIVRTLFGAGQFSAADVATTAFAFGIFCIVIPSESIIHLLVRSFYAQLDTKTPVAVLLVMTGANIGTGIFFARLLGVAGLPLGFAIASLLQAVVLYVLLKRKVPQLSLSQIGLDLSKVLVASALMAGGMSLVLVWVRSAFVFSTLVGMVQIGISAVVGGLIYILMSFILKHEVATALNARALRRGK